VANAKTGLNTKVGAVQLGTSGRNRSARTLAVGESSLATRNFSVSERRCYVVPAKLNCDDVLTSRARWPARSVFRLRGILPEVSFFHTANGSTRRTRRGADRRHAEGHGVNVTITSSTNRKYRVLSSDGFTLHTKRLGASRGRSARVFRSESGATISHVRFALNPSPDQGSTATTSASISIGCQ